MFSKRVNIFMGHYGSGKTFISVNYAEALKGQGKDVAVYDLDIVNPYFRTVDARVRLLDNGIQLIASSFAQSNVDLPSINPASYQIIDDKLKFAVIDVGGDDRGALALGRFSEKIKEEDNYRAYFVLNKFRPETNTIDGALEIKEEIEQSAKIKFTAIVNNANLGDLTTEENVLSGFEFAKEFSKRVGLPLVFTSVREDLINEKIKKEIKNILPVKPIKYGNWL